MFNQGADKAKTKKALLKMFNKNKIGEKYNSTTMTSWIFYLIDHN